MQPNQTAREQARLKAVAWREAAIADGWTSAPTYKHEPEERASSLSKEGFKASVISRTPQPRSQYLCECRFSEGSVRVWGPTGAAIKRLDPFAYDWDEIRTGERRCHYCKAEDVETRRVAFANLACANCYKAAVAKDEKPGWCD